MIWWCLMVVDFFMFVILFFEFMKIKCYLGGIMFIMYKMCGIRCGSGFGLIMMVILDVLYVLEIFIDVF